MLGFIIGVIGFYNRGHRALKSGSWSFIIGIIGLYNRGHRAL